ncbi:polysaccharide lyase family 8 super-sandwich domain-containing protein [Sporosarcina sp. NPDC096371]|uniref:polysaccharide lyase family 8 super-sandwich domain-containing protein n=1 Tax=Sporosarcina sp. NPDC096371 TaxID=3364530 RepID=UPI0037F8FBEB
MKKRSEKWLFTMLFTMCLSVLSIVIFEGATIKMVKADSPSNLALDKPVTYSGVEGGKVNGNWKYPQFVGEKAVDGDEMTRWSADKVDKQWLVVDLGEQQPIQMLTIKFHAESPDYELQVSADGITYQSVFKESNGSQGGAVLKTISFETTDARYVKYVQNKQFKNASNGQYYGSSIKELEVYKEVPQVIDVHLEDTEIQLTSGMQLQLTYTITPGYLTPSEQVEWASSDHEIATVSNDGLVRALQEGQAIISITTSNGKKAEAMVEVVAEKVQYVQMRNRWKEQLVGQVDLNVQDADVEAYVNKVSTMGEQLWTTLNKDVNRTYLWPRLSTDTVSADYTTQFNNLKKLALAYGIEGSVLYGNEALRADLLDALDFMVITKKYNGSYSTGNWWDWQIGSPQPFVDTLIILRDDLLKLPGGLERLDMYVKAISGYASDPAKQWPSYTATGANRTDIGISVLGAAILIEQDAKMKLVQQTVPDVFKMVKSGDGLYQDGSVVQHTNHAYTGSYGNELLKGVGRIQSIVAGTEWEMKDASIENVFQTVRNGYIPLMFRGQMMSMVNGRSISRAPFTNPFTTEFAAGSETIANTLLISQFASTEDQQYFKQAVKHWLDTSKNANNYFEHARDLGALLAAKEVINDHSISAAIPYKGMKVYGSMARAVQVKDSYAVGISMYSNRIANYEYGNTENSHGWHTADGMLYVYNADSKQFNEGYWPTVDPYRLPGTTVDTKPLADGVAQSKTSPQTWVGGATDGQVGAVGMYLDKTNLQLGMDLRAKKSWFLLNDAIVALGADIQGESASSIETIVENRLVTDEVFSLNNEQLFNEAQTMDVSARSWGNLAGKTKEESIGYYFPQQTSLTLQKETRVGKYADINGYFNNDQTYTNDYVKVLINHGKSVKDATYAYVILPGQTAQETKLYAEKNTLEILRNDAFIQAVKVQDSDMLLANIWSANGGTVYGITVDKPASIVATEEDGRFVISISNPTHSATKIQLNVDREDLTLLSSDTTVTETENGFEIDTTGAAGATHRLEFEVPEPVATLSAAEMKSLVEQYEKDGEFKHAVTARSLTTHLTAVAQYEKQEAAEKVVKHLQGFIVLLDYQLASQLISEKAHNALKPNAEALILQWQKTE